MQYVNQWNYLPGVLSDELDKLEKIAGRLSETKKLVPHYLLWTEAEREAVAFAKCYGEILMSNRVFTEETVESYYLGLDYPKESSSEHAFHMFFDSARQKANIRNRFSGVFLISLENWESGNARSPKFESLIEYVKDNESTIRFVFTLSLASIDAAYITGRLEEVIGVKQLDVPLPDIETAREYIRDELKKMNVIPTARDVGMVRRLLEEVQNSLNYKGFETLDRIVNQLVYAWISEDRKNKKEIMDKIKEQLMIQEEPRRIGFL